MKRRRRASRSGKAARKIPLLAQDSVPGCRCVLVPTDDPNMLAVDYCEHHRAGIQLRLAAFFTASGWGVSIGSLGGNGVEVLLTERVAKGLYDRLGSALVDVKQRQ